VSALNAYGMVMPGPGSLYYMNRDDSTGTCNILLKLNRLLVDYREDMEGRFGEIARS